MNDLIRRILFLPPQASTIAPDVDRLHFVVILTTMIASTLVGMAAIYFFVRYRRRARETVTPRVEPTWWFETLIVVVPLSFFLSWFGIGFRQYVRMASPPEGSLDLYVMAKQWMWKFSHPEGPNSINVLHVPAHRPIRLLLTSRDVIHSFYVPAFRIKMDVLPGRYTETWFEATEPGRYPIFCAEYCGLDHSRMRGEVVVLRPDDYDKWLLEQRRGIAKQQDASRPDRDPESFAGSMVEQGQAVAARAGCFKCHTLDGTPHIGPTWLDLYHRHERMNSGEMLTVDEGYITESMMDPAARVVAGFRPLMPTFLGKLTAPETAAIVEFIKSLRSERLQRGQPRPPPDRIEDLPATQIPGSKPDDVNKRPEEPGTQPPEGAL